MRVKVRDAIRESDGILELDAALVARDWLPPGRRLGLPKDAYDVGERGSICERWLGSTTHADNRIGPEDEGISYIRTESGERLNLRDAVEAAPDLLMGHEYAATHRGLGRLAKIYDFAARIPFHIHPPAEQASLVGRNSKDESSYFPPSVPMGAHPETFFGLHPHLAGEQGAAAILKDLERWCDDHILGHAFAYQQLPEEGFFVQSGILHGPGTALTIELQEDSDTLAMFQAMNAGNIISKELLFKDISPSDRLSMGEKALLRWIDWGANTDRDFYQNHHIRPRTIKHTGEFDEAWILYGSQKFSGKRLTVAPHATTSMREEGVYNLLVWSGAGLIGGHEVVGGLPGHDELLIVHDAARTPVEVTCTTDSPLVLIKFFGPDLNPESPGL